MVKKSEAELMKHLLDVGEKLTPPPTDPRRLLALLEETESVLSEVKQSPSKSVFTALQPAIKAVAAKKLLNQSDMDVKIVVASCLTEITRITAPQPPYDNDLMKVVFHLIVDAFKKLSYMSSPAYSKSVKILETVATTCSCVMLLDLDCDAIVLEMFQHFLRAISPRHSEMVFSSMENIMTLMLEESESIPSELLSCLLLSEKEDCKYISPTGRKLVKNVMSNCNEKLKPYLSDIQSTGTTLTVCGQDNSNAKIYEAQLVQMDMNEKLVGSRIEVWWPDDEIFYPGVVNAYSPATKKHLILYDDGDTEALMLNSEFWRFAHSSEAEQVQAKVIQSPDESSKRSITWDQNATSPRSSFVQLLMEQTGEAPYVGEKRSLELAVPRSNSVSGSFNEDEELTMMPVKLSGSGDGSIGNCLPQKRPFVESDIETKRSDTSTTEATEKGLKKAKKMEALDSVFVAKESAAKDLFSSKWTMKTCGTPTVPQDPSPTFFQDLPLAPASGTIQDPQMEGLDTLVNVSNTARIPVMATGVRGSTDVQAVMLVNDEEVEDLTTIEAEKRRHREKRRKEELLMALVIPSPLALMASTDADLHVDLPIHIFDSAFMEKIRLFSKINQNMWHQMNSEPLPNYAELADDFGRDAARDHGDLFNAIRQTPHYRGLDISVSGGLEDLWYKLPMVFEALHKSFKSQRFLERNMETMRGWLTELAQAGFDVSVPSAAFDLLTISPTDFKKFREFHNSVSSQLHEESLNVEALKAERPVSTRIAQLNSKIEDLKKQLGDLESEKMSLEPLKSVELELEKYGTSLKARKLQKLKELYEKEIVEAEQFLRDVSLDSWYASTELASLAH